MISAAHLNLPDYDEAKACQRWSDPTVLQVARDVTRLWLPKKYRQLLIAIERTSRLWTPWEPTTDPYEYWPMNDLPSHMWPAPKQTIWCEFDFWFKMPLRPLMRCG